MGRKKSPKNVPARRPGAISLLTAALLAKALELVSSGITETATHRYLGVSQSAWRAWKDKGRRLQVVDRMDEVGAPPYRQFYEGLEQARGQGRVVLESIVAKGAAGIPPEWGEVETLYRGKVIKLRQIIRPGTAPDPKLALEVLSRQYPKDWARLPPDLARMYREQGRAYAAIADHTGVPASGPSVEDDPAAALGLESEAQFAAICEAIAGQAIELLEEPP